jgi:AraC-like DNA-binding protein
MQPLQRLLQDKFVPWTQAGSFERVIVARPRMKSARLPDGVKLTYRKMPGERMVVKSGRLYGNVRQVCARWPEAGMHETEHPRAFWVAEGQVNCQVGNYVLGCKTGDFVLMPPRTPHPADRHPLHLVTSNIPNQSCLLLWMSLYRRGFQCWLSEYEHGGHRHDSPAENYLFLNGQLVQLFRMLVEETLGEGNRSLCGGLLTAFGAAVQREVETARFLLPGSALISEEAPGGSTDFITQLEDYVRQHINQPLTLERVAHELYMSRTQFARRIRQETGQSFVEFLNARRVKEAQNLLRESEWTVRAIAQFIGFKSPAYFHAFFLRHTGCTPGAYRHNGTPRRARKNGSI